MPSFSDSIVLFVLALLLFGPKRLPVLARELGKWVGEFRRASNEFKMQMEEELRLSEQADRQKQIAAIETAAPITPPIEQPAHPHLPPPDRDSEDHHPDPDAKDLLAQPATEPSAELIAPEPVPQTTPLPIATSGDLHLMPPSTGLPTPRHTASHTNGNPLGGLLDAIPEAPETPEAPTPETAAHGH